MSPTTFIWQIFLERYKHRQDSFLPSRTVKSPEKQRKIHTTNYKLCVKCKKKDKYKVLQDQGGESNGRASQEGSQAKHKERGGGVDASCEIK